MHTKQKIRGKVSVFDALLCRLLALAWAGCDYSQELAAARTLAQLMEGRRQR